MHLYTCVGLGIAIYADLVLRMNAYNRYICSCVEHCFPAMTMKRGGWKVKLSVTNKMIDGQLRFLI